MVGHHDQQETAAHHGLPKVEVGSSPAKLAAYGPEEAVEWRDGARAAEEAGDAELQGSLCPRAEWAG